PTRRSSDLDTLNLTKATPIIKPTINPPIEDIKNCSTAFTIENPPVNKAATAILKEIIPAASFNNDSPSKIVIEPFGRIFPFVIARTATASVGHKIAANANAAANGNSGHIQCTNNPTTITVVTTSPKAIINTGLIYRRKWTRDTFTPSTNNNGAISATINSSESKWNSTGIGVIYNNIPSIIWIKARGILGKAICTRELAITTAKNISIVSNICMVSPLFNIND